MSRVVWVILQFFNDFDLFGEIFGVGVAVKVLISGPAEPVGFSPQLIREISVIVLGCVFGNKVVGVGGLASEWEVAAGVPISGLHVLIFSFIPREL